MCWCSYSAYFSLWLVLCACLGCVCVVSSVKNNLVDVWTHTASRAYVCVCVFVGKFEFLIFFLLEYLLYEFSILLAGVSVNNISVCVWFSWKSFLGNEIFSFSYDVAVCVIKVNVRKDNNTRCVKDTLLQIQSANKIKNVSCYCKA